MPHGPCVNKLLSYYVLNITELFSHPQSALHGLTITSFSEGIADLRTAFYLLGRAQPVIPPNLYSNVNGKLLSVSISTDSSLERQ